MKYDYATHQVDMKVYMSSPCMEQMKAFLRKEKAAEDGDDLELAAMCMVCAGKALHGMDHDDVQRAAALATVVEAASVVMLSVINAPFGKFQVAFSPGVKALIICGENETNEMVQTATKGVAHIQTCKKKVHDGDCLKDAGAVSFDDKETKADPKKGVMKDMLSMISNFSKQAKKPEPPETKNRIKDYDNPSSN